jgi:hypothetical protein
VHARCSYSAIVVSNRAAAGHGSTTPTRSARPEAEGGPWRETGGPDWARLSERIAGRARISGWIPGLLLFRLEQLQYTVFGARSGSIKNRVSESEYGASLVLLNALHSE